MRPTINSTVKSPDLPGDTIYVNKFKNFGVNDIVVVDVASYPELHVDNIIKRIVATPGDRLQIKDHSTFYGVYVNDNLLYKRQLKGENENIQIERIKYYEKYIAFLNKPENDKYVTIINSEKYIVMPEGEYFLMGDNWEGTLDSFDFGPIKEKIVVGKVEAILPQSHINFFTPTWFMLKLIFKN